MLFFQDNIVINYIFKSEGMKTMITLCSTKTFISHASWWEKLPVHVLIKCFPNCFIITYNWRHTVQFHASVCFLPLLKSCWHCVCLNNHSYGGIHFQTYFHKLFSRQENILKVLTENVFQKMQTVSDRKLVN